MDNIEVVKTEEWGAQAPLIRAFPTQPIEGVVLHCCGACLTSEQPSDPLDYAHRLARQLQEDDLARSLTDSRHHFLITYSGLIVEGRHGSLSAARAGHLVRGAHALSEEALFNDCWVGVIVESPGANCLSLPRKQMGALLALYVSLSEWSGNPTLPAIPYTAVRSDANPCPEWLSAAIEEMKPGLGAISGFA